MAGDEPYVGLRPYDIGDRDLFYGRGRASRDVSALWQGNRLLVLYGPSGVGKTSLIQAGVIARFNHEAADVLPVGRVTLSSAFPTADLPEHNPYDFALLSSWSPGDSPTHLVGLSLMEFLSRRDTRTDRYGDPLPVLAAIDQFEEAFSGFPHRQPYLDQFIDHLADAVRNIPSLRLLISIREDALAKIIPRETRLAGHSRARLQVLPLTRDAALQAVAGPLVGTRRSFAPGVAEEFVDHLLTTDITSHVGEITTVTVESVEPVQLQVACTTLWRALPEEVTTITEEHLHRHGDVDRTGAELCKQMVAEVAGEYQIPESKLYEWLERTFVTKRGLRGIAYEGMSETGGIPNLIALALEDRGILKSRQRSGSRWYELQHDRLIDLIRQANRPQSAETVSDAGPVDYLRTAESALANGEFQLAQKHAEEALRMCSDRDVRTRAEAESLLGEIAFQRDRLAEAEGHYRNAAEQFETLQDKAAVARLLATIGQLLLARSCYADAVDALQAAVARLPGDPDVQLQLARALWSSSDPRAAAALSRGIATIAPDAAEALVRQLRVELNDPASVLRDLDKLLSLRKGIDQRADVRAGRALALARLGRIQEAVAEADAAVQEAPGSGPVLLRAAGVARAAGEPSRADEFLRRADDARNPHLFPSQLAEIRRLFAEAA